MRSLFYCHKNGICHRDLKPENVLLDHVGHIKLADLGLAKILKDDTQRTTSFCGTEAYLAPEMILRVPYAYSVDYWQYGCFVFELYAGRYVKLCMTFYVYDWLHNGFHACRCA